MKIEFEITYDAGKLQKAMPKMIREYMNGALGSLFKGSKEAIKSGKLEKLKQSTLDIRANGTSPNSGYSKTNSKHPLRHTRRLFQSIKMYKKDKELEFMKYGIYHTGVNENMNKTLDEFESEAGRKTGIAYKTSEKSMIPNKIVPIRDWLRFDKTINTIKKTFFETLDKSFKKNG